MHHLLNTFLGFWHVICSFFRIFFRLSSSFSLIFCFIRTKNKLSKDHLLGILFCFFHLYETDGVRSKYNILWYLHADMKNVGGGGGGKATFLYTTLRNLILDFEKTVTYFLIGKNVSSKNRKLIILIRNVSLQKQPNVV